MNCFQIEVRGVTFTVWAPTLQEAVETFMIDMDFFEVPIPNLVPFFKPSNSFSLFSPKFFWIANRIIINLLVFL